MPPLHPFGDFKEQPAEGDEGERDRHHKPSPLAFGVTPMTPPPALKGGLKLAAAPDEEAREARCFRYRTFT
jgi:hypothetical protein